MTSDNSLSRFAEGYARLYQQADDMLSQVSSLAGLGPHEDVLAEERAFAGMEDVRDLPLSHRLILTSGGVNVVRHLCALKDVIDMAQGGIAFILNPDEYD